MTKISGLRVEAANTQFDPKLVSFNTGAAVNVAVMWKVRKETTIC